MPWHNTNIFEDNNKLIPEAEPYTGSSSVLKLNHPLMIMVKEQRVVSISGTQTLAFSGLYWPFFFLEPTGASPLHGLGKTQMELLWEVRLLLHPDHVRRLRRLFDRVSCQHTGSL